MEINRNTNQIELTRPAGIALRRTGAANHFYTHSRRLRFNRSPLAIPAISNREMGHLWQYAVTCGRSMNWTSPDALPGCPQCGHDRDPSSQLDLGQQRDFIEFPRSQAISYMEHYDSLSGDRDEERHRECYQIIRSFDLDCWRDPLALSATKVCPLAWNTVPR